MSDETTDVNRICILGLGKVAVRFQRLLSLTQVLPSVDIPKAQESSKSLKLIKREAAWLIEVARLSVVLIGYHSHQCDNMTSSIINQYFAQLKTVFTCLVTPYTIASK